MRNTPKWIQILCCIVFISFIGFSQAWAVIIDFNPSSSSILVSDSIDIDIVISGLENIDVGAFDFNVSYNDAALTFDSYTLGSGLGDIALFEADDWSFGDLGSGVINLAEVSYLWDLSFQPDSFILATLSFMGNATGSSTFSFSNVIIGDEWGNELPASTGTGNIDVTAPVPEPATMILFGLGILGIAGLNRKKYSR